MNIQKVLEELKIAVRELNLAIRLYENADAMTEIGFTKKVGEE